MKTVETFKKLDQYELNILENTKPSAVNSLRYRKYKITIELIEESDEVLTKRLQKLYDETNGYRKRDMILKEAEHKGFVINKNE